MLGIIFNNITVKSMRPEYPGKAFSSEDVPHGSDSVYYKAAKILIHTRSQDISLPQFTDEEKQTLIDTRKTSISAVAELTNDKLPVLEQTEVLNPTAEETAAEFAKEGTPGRPLYADEAAATAALVDQRKTTLATDQVNRRIEQCLDVPTLSAEWKDQFTTVETE